MARITSENAANVIGSRYDLILIASRRARELKSGHAPYVRSENSEIVTALREIEAGHIGRDYLHKAPELNNDRKRKSKS